MKKKVLALVLFSSDACGTAGRLRKQFKYEQHDRQYR